MRSNATRSALLSYEEIVLCAYATGTTCVDSSFFLVTTSTKPLKSHVPSNPHNYTSLLIRTYVRAYVLVCTQLTQHALLYSVCRLLQIIPENTPLQRAFSVADDVLRQGVVGISEIIIR